MYFAGKGTAGGALALKGPTLPAARIRQAIDRVQQAHLASDEASFFVWARKQEPEYFKALLADLAEVSAEQLQSVMHDFGDKTDFRVLNLGGGECAGASQVLIGANFFEAAHEREYRNALVFQRKYVEAAQCNESILRLLGSGVAQLLGGARQEDLAKLAEQLNLLAPEEIAAEFAHAAQESIADEEVNNEALAVASAKVDAWTIKVAAFATEKRRTTRLEGGFAKMSTDNRNELNKKIAATIAVLQQAASEYSSVVFANSLGAEDMVLTDLIAKHQPDIQMFSLDTGRLPKETYDLIHEVGQQYEVPLKVYFPDSTLVQDTLPRTASTAFTTAWRVARLAATCARWNRCAVPWRARAPGSPACVAIRQ